MAANVNTLKATIERYRKEIDALRGQLKAGQQYLNEQRERASSFESLYRTANTVLRSESEYSQTLSDKVRNAGVVQRLRYLFTGRL